MSPQGATGELTAGAETPTPEAPAPAGIPEGQARLIVNNGFDQKIRFTPDKQFLVDPESNLSAEWDLEPGQSVAILVYPGQIGFTASTAWQGLSDNANVVIGPDQELIIWLYFVLDPDGSGNWNLQF